MLTAVDIGAAPPTTVHEETARVIPETDSEDEIEAQRPLATKLSIHPQRNNRKGSQGGYGPGVWPTGQSQRSSAKRTSIPPTISAIASGRASGHLRKSLAWIVWRSTALAHQYLRTMEIF
jgi:hypothetical protein